MCPENEAGKAKMRHKPFATLPTSEIWLNMLFEAYVVYQKSTQRLAVGFTLTNDVYLLRAGMARGRGKGKGEDIPNVWVKYIMLNVHWLQNTKKVQATSIKHNVLRILSCIE